MKQNENETIRKRARLKITNEPTKHLSNQQTNEWNTDTMANNITTIPKTTITAGETIGGKLLC